MTFLEAFNHHGPDTMAIASDLGISEAEAERLIHEHREAARAEKAKKEARAAYCREWMRKHRAALAELRAKRAGQCG